MKVLTIEVCRALRLAGVITVLAVFSLGCTTIPDRQLQAYRQVFTETRSQSEQILADHAAARQMKSNLAAQVRLRTNPALAHRSLSERLEIATFDATGVSVPNDIEVRLKAWDVIATYNEALAAVAAGVKSRKRIHGSSKGFSGH
jgi:hypothetical protein